MVTGALRVAAIHLKLAGSPNSDGSMNPLTVAPSTLNANELIVDTPVAIGVLELSQCHGPGPHVRWTV